MGFEDFIQSVKKSVNEHNGPKEGDKVKVHPGRVRGSHSKEGKIGTLVGFTPNSRSEGGNCRGDIGIVKWEDGKTTNEVYYGLVKVK
jgi:hypothetical protein